MGYYCTQRNLKPINFFQRWVLFVAWHYMLVIWEKFFSWFWVHFFGGSSNNKDNWMANQWNSEYFYAKINASLTNVVFLFKCYVQVFLLSALVVHICIFKSHVLVLFGRVESYLVLKSHESQKLSIWAQSTRMRFW